MVDIKEISGKQKQIAVSEFFEKNKHFLGFDSLQRSLITAVKEAVDNSLDACEEARILPNIRVQIDRLKGDEIRLVTQDYIPLNINFKKVMMWLEFLKENGNPGKQQKI